MKSKNPVNRRTRLDRYLSERTRDSRSEIKKIIRAGGVSVDGNVIKDPGFYVTCEKTVLYQGRQIESGRLVYYMLNKPAGVISATEDRHQSTVLDLVSENDRRKDLFPVGRLDKDTRGLLLITNDGSLAHRLLSPAFHVDKVYYAEVSGLVTGDIVKAFEGGLQIDSAWKALPAGLEILQTEDPAGQAGPVSRVKVTIREGKFHQVKRMFQAVGMEVLYLKRLQMGSLVLDPELGEGSYRTLTGSELNRLKWLKD